MDRVVSRVLFQVAAFTGSTEAYISHTTTRPPTAQTRTISCQDRERIRKMVEREAREHNGKRAILETAVR